MNKLKNDRLIRALLREPVDRTPIWLMRQAGRYLPEYRALRKRMPDFMQFCKTPELACEATLQPIRRFPLDAAIVFSDILTIPDAMGMTVSFAENEGPMLASPIRDLRGVEQLRHPEINREFAYVIATVQQVVKSLDNKIPLIGFAGSPWTVATYMIEGGGSKTFRHSKMLLYTQPKVVHALLKKLTHITIDYINAQIAAGVRVAMIFDTWGGILSQEEYWHFSVKYMKQIAQGVNRQINGNKIPLIFFTKNGGQWLEEIANSGCDAIGIDATVNINEARRRVGDRVALQGNLDPFVLFAEHSYIRLAVQNILTEYGHGPGHVFNLGHGIDKDTPIESVDIMIKAIHEFSLTTIQT